MSGPGPDDGGPGADLSRDALAPLLGGRPLRTYPAMLSTEAEALRWARHGAVHGSVVTAGHVAAPRGRSGLDWDAHARVGRGLACSVVLRPDLPARDEDWAYLPALLALGDVLPGTALEWPDHLVRDDVPVAAVGVQAATRAGRLDWVVVTLLAFGPGPPRGPLLAGLLDALEHRVDAARDDVLAAARRVCRTLGRHVEAALLPMGPASPTVTGRAVDLAPDGGLVLLTDDDERMVVLPGALGLLRDAGTGPAGPER